MLWVAIALVKKIKSYLLCSKASVASLLLLLVAAAAACVTSSRCSHLDTTDSGMLSLY